MKFNKNQTLGFTSKLSDFEIVNQEFIRCKCYMLATGDNVNGSDITLESVQKAMARGEFYNKPVVAHLYRDPEDNNKWRVGGHDSKWIITNTSFDIVNECIPFGVIPESSCLQLEEVLEADGKTINTYLTCQIILWVGRYNIMDAAYSDDVYFNQSCELSINEYHYKDNDVLSIDDFTFSALCLLNKSSDPDKNVRPCFPSCRVEKMKTFSIDANKFKQNFELMLEKLKQYESDSTSTTTVQNTITNNNSQTKGDNKMDFEKIINALSTETYKNSENKDAVKYHLLNVTDTKIFALDMESYTPCGFNYTVAKDTETGNEYTVIDFDSKIEMSFSASEKINDESFKEFSIQDEINSAIERFAKKNDVKNDEKIQQITNELKENFQKDYDELKESYDSLVQAHTIVTSRIESYEKQEKEAEIQRHKEDIDSLVDSYSAKLEKCSAYLIYKASMDKNYSKTREEVEQDLILMAGKYLTRGETIKKKNFAYSPTESGVGASGVSSSLQNRYGHLLDKYIS